MNGDPSELDALIHAALDDHATEEQIARLNALLQTNAADRDRYLQLADIHSCLAVDEQLWVDEAAPARSISTAPTVWQGRRLASFFAQPLAATATGLIIGLFGASLVFAYVIPRVQNETVRFMPIFVESFEDEKMVPRRGFPSRAEAWSGDLSGSIAAEDGVMPKDGGRMVRLAPSDKRKFCYAWRIVDLDAYPMPPEAKSRQVEVRASFHGNRSGAAERHQIRLAALAEEPGKVRAIWNAADFLDRVLLHVGRTVTAGPDEQGWHTLHATIEIPPGARSLVISLAAAMADDSAPKTAHYLDDIHVKFVIKENVQ